MAKVEVRVAGPPRTVDNFIRSLADEFDDVDVERNLPEMGTSEVLAILAIGIATNASYDLVKAVITRLAKEAGLRLHVGRRGDEPEGSGHHEPTPPSDGTHEGPPSNRVSEG